MPSRRGTVSTGRIFLTLIALVAAACGGPAAVPASSARPEVAVPAPGWPAEQAAVHLLNRCAFGPSPADLAEVRRLGPSEWLRRQLVPGSIDDTALAARLRAFPTLAMTNAELHAGYPRKPADAARAPRVIGRELAAQKVLRAVESRRQLEEVLTDFWFNHFNVFDGKGQDRWLVTSYERDAIRPHVLGRFRDLLEATATAPAMLFYLDNWVSTREDFRGARRGLNENYARELLELHTLGVDGGYTQRDVREVARCFTGWSIERPGGAATFVFRANAHDRGAKEVLGVPIPAGGGREDGERVLDLLARHPATARRVATLLCQRFVADAPPPGLVDRMARLYLRTGGDLRAVVAAIATSPELWSEAALGAKTKSPLELVASSVRALGARVDDPAPLAGAIARLGEPLYACAPPTGYGETAERWLAGGLLLARLRFGEALAAGRLRGVTVDPACAAAGARDPQGAVAALSRALLGGSLPETTRSAVALSVTSERPDAVPAATAALLLGSPEFQRR